MNNKNFDYSRKGVGRPVVKFEISWSEPFKDIENIKKLCRNNDKIKDNIQAFSKELLDFCDEGNTETKATQTHETNIISEIIENSTEDLAYIISNLWESLKSDDKIKLLMLFYDDLEFHEQCDFLSFLGHSLNDIVYNATKNLQIRHSDFNLDDLKTANKKEFYKASDKRLQSFIDNLTQKKEQPDNENINFKSNIVENILKARSKNYVSEVGLKEHMVSYLASGKSIHSSQIFSKQGGKGTRPVLEKVLKNSEESLTFSAPEKSFLYFSFDNIQKLLKSYRIGGNHQHKVLAIVVCSILCLLFENGDKKCDLQYMWENTPALWYSEYTHVEDKDVYVDKLSTDTLRQCAKMEKNNLNVIDEYFENELKDALNFVAADMDESLRDSVDFQTRAEIAKKRKLCQSGHINDHVRSNRTTCDRKNCKSLLKENDVFNKSKPTVVNIDQDISKAEIYLNVPNISIDDIPKEMPVGAMAINPNNPERISKVLDEIIENANMKNKYSVKLCFEKGKISKKINENPEFRKFVVVTSDGLPYKAMIELIKNTHTCAECGKKLRYISEVTDHIKETHHIEYFQTYGNILPNIGHFHYSLTMLRSLVKLEWNLDFEELVKAIHFETPKALFMQEKVTDFRKSLDTYRTVRKAKLREFVTPFIKYAKENDLAINVDSFLLWKKWFVKCKTYQALFEIERVFGTSFILYHASLRANNFKLVNIAKKVFSSLFHINNHPNYSVMDIHTEYLDHKLAEKAPELYEYLQKRKCSNFTKRPYAHEPFDERHEEYNKRGLNMQNIKTVEDFKQSFKLIDKYMEMKESVFDDYNIKIHGGNVPSVVNYEGNVLKMRVAMRKQSYLNRPEKENGMFSMDNKELNPKIADIVKIAQDQRQENILKVMRHNDFSSGFTSGVKFKTLKDEGGDKLETNFETQLNILIASEENADMRENLLEYCKSSRLHPEFDEEKIVDDILTRNFAFLNE